jgi:cholesterol oxidase
VSGSVRFTEEMAGFAWPGAPDPVGGFARGRTEDCRLRFVLTIAVDDVDAFLAEPERTARATGFVEARFLGGRQPVDAGEFNLFVPGPSEGMWTMRYRLPFRDGQRRALVLDGHKEIEDGAGLDAWRDTTRLATTIRPEGPSGDGGGPAIARGILAITPGAFARQLTTFRGDPRAIATFGVHFGKVLWAAYVARRRRRPAGA